MTEFQEILDFWFVETPPERQFSIDPEFDAAVRTRFAQTWQEAGAGRLSAWEGAPESALALVILLDQFPRNMFRGEAAAFSTDALALGVASRAVERKFDLAVAKDRQSFFYLPFMHSENLGDQESGVALITERLSDAKGTLRYAIRHRDAIKRFGRFPARNRALARTDSDEELAYLKTNPAGF